MKKLLTPILAALALMTIVLPLAATVSAQALPQAARAYLGEWRTIDDETGEAKSIVQVYEQGGRVFGRIARILPTAANPSGSSICSTCDEDSPYHGREIAGLVIIRDMEWNASNNKFEDGRILNPQDGKDYHAWMELLPNNRLKVKGFIRIGPIRVGKEQIWERVR